MTREALEFAATVRFVEKARESLILDLASRKWVRLPSSGLRAIRARLEGAEVGGGNGAPTGGNSTHGVSAKQVEATLDYLRRQSFLQRPGETPQPAETRRRTAKRTLHFHVTQNCNLACATCYVAEFLRRGPDALDLAGILRILRTAAGTGEFGRLSITGGEPLLRKDILEILGEGRRLFSSVTLTTNGMALTPKMCRGLGPVTDTINVSIDGPVAEVHDRIRGEGTFVRALRGLENLRDSGYPMHQVCLGPTPTRLNHESLEDVLDLAASFGCDVAFGFFIPTGRGLCNQERLTLATREMVDLFERAATKRRVSLGLPENPQPGEDPEMAFGRVRTDCSVDTILTIQADGSILPCPNLNQPEHQLGNVLEMDDETLEAMLRSPTGKDCYRCRQVDRVPGCRRCEARYFCGGGCMANAYMVTRDLYGKDPYCGFYREMWRRHGPLQQDYRKPRRGPQREHRPAAEAGDAHAGS